MITNLSDSISFASKIFGNLPFLDGFGNNGEQKNLAMSAVFFILRSQYLLKSFPFYVSEARYKPHISAIFSKQ